MTTIRTRFAPSPTGYLHVGGARTALFSWAYARKHGGTFILRIEDTDLERSTPESVQAILDGMAWLGLQHDEGPFYQTQRMARYAEVIQRMLAEGSAYHCYCSKDELDVMRAEQEKRGEKPRYDRRWRPEPGKTLPAAPAGVPPVVRLKTPLTGTVKWTDVVKGDIEISNEELDDFIIARADGTPTYNFCVVVDDWDMGITHVIRGDDHVNNTPRQINLLAALGAPIPQYGHVPMILGGDGERLSKRHGATSVMQYAEDGYLPEGLLNYLARLGWAHGDAEVFDLEGFVEMFEVGGISRSPARFDMEKLRWVNQQHLKRADDQRLADLAAPFLRRDGADLARGPALATVVALLKERVATVEELADAAACFYRHLPASPELLAQHITDEVESTLNDLQQTFRTLDWQREQISAAIKAAVQAAGVKFPKIAMPLRVMTTGTTQTPAVEVLLELLGREETVRRMSVYLEG